MSAWHAVHVITDSETLCGRKWRHDPNLQVETEWKRVTCKRCLVKVEQEVAEIVELEKLLHEVTP